jgi:hypothetical protein
MTTKSESFAAIVAIMKTDIEYLKRGQENLTTSINDFIKSADNKYATKQELSFITEKLSDSKSTVQKIIDIGIKVAPWIIILIYLFFGKVLGV